jgi:SNF2 family DNA or RNA helicase
MSVTDFLAKIKAAGDYPELGVPSIWNPEFKLAPFQKIGAAFLGVRKRFILGDETGAGKTIQQLYAWALLRDQRRREGKTTRLWIITLRSAVDQWASEIRTFFTQHNIHLLKSETNDGKPINKEKRIATFKRWVDDQNDPILISHWGHITHDWLEYDAATKDTPWLEDTEIAADEVQKAKNKETQLGVNIRDLMSRAGRVHGLTATLVQNKAHDAHSVVEAISPGTMSLGLFEKLHCNIEYKEIRVRGKRKKIVKETTGYHHLKEFAETIGHLYLGRVGDEIEGQRPTLVYNTRTIVATPKQQKLYLGVEKGMLLAEDSILKEGPLLQTQQAANTPDIWWGDERVPKDMQIQDNAKADLLEEVWDNEIGDDPVILYSNLSTTVDNYVKRFAHKNSVRITGKENDQERQKARLDFQEGRTNSIFITDAGGAALNLQRAKHVVLISRPWSPGQLIQVLGRARRIGSKHSKVIVWNLTVKNTIDEYIDGLLLEKFGNFDAIIRSKWTDLTASEIMPLDIVKYARKQRIRETAPE